MQAMVVAVESVIQQPVPEVYILTYNVCVHPLLWLPIIFNFFINKYIYELVQCIFFASIMFYVICFASY